MSLPFYVSPEQWMQDKAEYARKGIARGKAIACMEYQDGVVIVAENASSSLNKVSEIYDHIGFAGVGKYSEFENLRRAGIRYVDVKGYMYSREDVSSKSLANAFSEALGNTFTRDLKPMEIEVLVVDVGVGGVPCMYHVSFDGSISDHAGFVVIGGHADEIVDYLKEHYRPGLSFEEALWTCVEGLESVADTQLGAGRLEVAVLDRNRPRRKFCRIARDLLEEALANRKTGPR